MVVYLSVQNDTRVSYSILVTPKLIFAVGQKGISLPTGIQDYKQYPRIGQFDFNLSKSISRVGDRGSV